MLLQRLCGTCFQFTSSLVVFKRLNFPFGKRELLTKNESLKGTSIFRKRFTDVSLSFVTPQDNVLNIITQIMDECIPNDRANRDFSVKFPEEIRHDNLAGQLWFGAEVAYHLHTLVENKTSHKSNVFSNELNFATGMLAGFHVFRCQCNFSVNNMCKINDGINLPV